MRFTAVAVDASVINMAEVCNENSVLGKTHVLHNNVLKKNIHIELLNIKFIVYFPETYRSLSVNVILFV